MVLSLRLTPVLIIVPDRYLLFLPNLSYIILVAATAGNTDILGKTPYESAKIMEYIHMTNYDLPPAYFGLLVPTLGFCPFDQENYDRCMVILTSYLSQLEKRIKGKKFILFDRLTMADIKIATFLSHYMMFTLDAEKRKPFPEVTRYFSDLMTLPQFKAVLGDVKLCEHELPPNALKI